MNKSLALVLAVFVLVALVAGGVYVFVFRRASLSQPSGSGDRLFQNPFDTSNKPSGSFGKTTGPSASFENPFAEVTPTTYQNPFGSTGTGSQSYQNPFDALR